MTGTPVAPPSRAYRFFAAYMGIGGALREHLEPLLERRFGIGLRDYMVLNTVHREVRYPTEIAAHLRTTKDVVSRTINKLQQAKLVERKIDADDSRRMRLELTHTGIQTREAVKSELEAFIEASFATLQSSESERLVSSLETLSHLLKTPLGDTYDEHR